ncbi:hypothetical protein GCM10029992_41600 [Glycomyces albus]
MSVAASREAIRSAAPRIVPVGDESDMARDPSGGTARLPTVAWETAKASLDRDRPVLVQVPRRGYVPAVSCQRCRTRAVCPHCSGPLRLTGSRRAPVCGWCGKTSHDHRCRECGSAKVRARVIGAERTAEEMAGAFGGVEVVESTGRTAWRRLRAAAWSWWPRPEWSRPPRRDTARCCCWTRGRC